MKKILSLLTICLLLISCNKNQGATSKNISSEERQTAQKNNLISQQEGYNTLKTNCYTCHNPNASSHDNILAPPLAGIKYKYKSLYPKEEQFVSKMTDFIDLPSKEKALMKGPVNKFGVMPKTALSKSQIQELVTFIYNNEMEIPEWFPEHFEEQHGVKWENIEH